MREGARRHSDAPGSERWFASAFRYAPLAMGVITLDGRILRANAALARLTGYAEADLVGRAIDDLSHPDDVAAGRAARAALGNTPSVLVEQRFITREGTTIAVRVAASRMERCGSWRVCAVLYVQDVAERTDADPRLRESEARFRALIEKSQDLVGIFDLDGTIRYASPSHEKVLGYLPSDAEGRNAFELVHPDDVDGVRRAFDEAIAVAGSSTTREFRFLHKDGSWRTIEATATNRLDDPALRGAVVNSHDVTARRAADAALVAKQHELETVVYALTHDLKRPLTTITITADLLRSQCAGRLTAEERDELDRIHRLSARTEDMIRALLGFFRVTQVGEEAGWVELDAVVAHALDAMRAQLDQKHVTPEVGRLPRVWGQAAKLGHVLANLLANAVSYVSTGSGLIRITGVADVAWVTLTVADNGIGIPALYGGVIFELFGRVPPELQVVDGRAVDGTGVGLALVKRIVEAHGGTVAVASEPGCGSRFTVKLPQVRSAADRLVSMRQGIA